MGRGARAPPIACKLAYAKSHVFRGFEAEFCSKNENNPPKGFGCRSCEVVAVIRPEKSFEFPILAEKFVSISAKTFFLEITCFWAENPFEFPILAEISMFCVILNQGSDSRTMKIRVKVACSCLTLSRKPPPPFFQILATRLLKVQTSLLG